MNLANAVSWVALTGCLPTAIVSVAWGRLQLSLAAWAMYWLLWYISDALDHDLLGEIIDAVFFAIYAYWWWNGGGGDDTKRRFRLLVRKFTPVRRTAPAAT
jgi:hypothetical protein